MRQLLKSELRAINNIALMRWGIAACINQAVFHVSEGMERARPSSNRDNFNRDFLIEFIDRTTLPGNAKTAMVPILPNAVGAELYLTVDGYSFRPLLLELLGGAAFGLSYYKEYVSKIYRLLDGRLSGELATALQSTRLSGMPWETSGAPELIPAIEQMSRVRIMIIRSDICFSMWAGADGSNPEHFSRKRFFDSEYDVDVFVDNQGGIGVDGWIHADVKQDEWKIAATL